MENRITKVLDKMEKSYKISEEGCIILEFTSVSEVIGISIEFVEIMEIKIVNEELGLVRVTETVKCPAMDEIVKRQEKNTTIDGVINTLLEYCICELDNE